MHFRAQALAAERQRLRDEANARRAEAAVERERETTETGKTIFKSQVEPQIEALLEDTQHAQPSAAQTEPKPKKQPKPKKLAAIKAERIGVSRAAVERAEQIKRFDEENGSDYAEQVKNDKIAATAAGCRALFERLGIDPEDGSSGAVLTAAVRKFATFSQAADTLAADGAPLWRDVPWWPMLRA